MKVAMKMYVYVQYVCMYACIKVHCEQVLCVYKLTHNYT